MRCGCVKRQDDHDGSSGPFEPYTYLSLPIYLVRKIKRNFHVEVEGGEIPRSGRGSPTQSGTIHVDITRDVDV